MNLRSAAHALGGELHTDGSILAPGPGHGKADRSMSVRFLDGDDFVVTSFANDDWQTCKDHVRSVLGLASFDAEAEARLQERREQRALHQTTPPRGNYAEAAQRLWEGATWPRATPGEVYLRERGIALPEHVCGRCIRFHVACPFADQETGRRWVAPALVARFTPIVGGDELPVSAIHRIELLGGARHGVKKMLGSVAGQVIKLDADEDVCEGLALAEGIETALAFSQLTAWRPIWACGAVGGIARFPPLSGIETITVAVDHDPSRAGPEAVRALEQRCRGIELRWVMPKRIGADFADLIEEVHAGRSVDELVLSYG